ncbi:MAG: IS5 family transposase [Ktedonobacteraceae bacterium]
MPKTLHRNAYPSDLTDEQWALLEPLVPALSPEAAYQVHERREIVNAILYVLRSGCPWRMLPHEFPAWGTVYYYFRRWQREGTWDQVLRALRMQVRRKQGRDEEPSAAIIDSQSIKTSAVRGREKGYDMGKKIWGRKRHALVDTQGNLLAVKVTGAERSDQEGGRPLLKPLKELLPRLKLVWGDSHYGGTFRMWAKITLGWTIQTIKALTVPKRGLLVSEGEEVDWEKLFPTGFRPQPRRWVIERTFSWIIRWRRLCRDHEGLPSSSEALIKIAMGSRMLNILMPPHFSY